MTNYIIENDIDFYAELNKQLNSNDEDPTTDDGQGICLISGDTLDDTAVKLLCGHEFNYLPLYKEIKTQKGPHRSRIDVTTMCLTVSDIRCPYCRNIQKKLIPYKEIEGVDEIIGINYPEKYVMLEDTCQYVFVTGNKKGMQCNEPCNGKHCKRHVKVLERKAKLSAFKKELSHPHADMTEDEIIDQTVTRCTAVLKTGKNKGSRCKIKEFKNCLCKRHYEGYLLKEKKNINN